MLMVVEAIERRKQTAYWMELGADGLFAHRLNGFTLIGSGALGERFRPLADRSNSHGRPNTTPTVARTGRARPPSKG